MLSIAGAFQSSPEFTERFGSAPTDEALINTLYQNVLGRPGDKAGVDFWLSRRSSGMSISELLLAFADSPENEPAPGPNRRSATAGGSARRRPISAAKRCHRNLTRE